MLGNPGTGEPLQLAVQAGVQERPLHLNRVLGDLAQGLLAELDALEQPGGAAIVLQRLQVLGTTGL